MSYRPERRKEDEELLELFRDEWERRSRFWPLLNALRHCVSWGEPIPAWLEQALTDPKQPYQIGFRDGYEQAKREIRDETYLAVARIEAKTAKLSVETQAMHAELVRMRTPDGAADNEPDPPTQPN